MNELETIRSRIHEIRGARVMSSTSARSVFLGASLKIIIRIIIKIKNLGL